MAASKKKIFTYTLLGTGPGKAFPYVEVPFDTVAFFGTKGRIPVKVTVNGVELPMSLAPMGGRHVLGFRRELAERAKVAVGDTVKLTLELDEAPRTVEVPAELAAALRKNAAAKRAWEALSYSHQREHAEAIAAAKKPETRARRVEKALEMLTSGGGPARPAPSTKPLAARLGIKPGMKAAVLDAPKGFSLGAPSSADPKDADVVLSFVATRAAVRAAVATWTRVGGALWIASPKKTSGVESDLSRDVGWEPLERAGYHPVTQVSVDDTWSALRFKKNEA